MNADDDLLMKALAERVGAAVLLPIDAIRVGYALGVAREITDHAKDKPVVETP